MSQDLDSLKKEINNDTSLSVVIKNEMLLDIGKLEASESELQKLLSKSKSSKLENFLVFAVIYLMIIIGISLLLFCVSEYLGITSYYLQ